VFFWSQSIFLRQLLASVAQRTVESLPPRATRWPDYFDNTEGIGAIRRPAFYRDRRSGVLLPYKGRAAFVPPEQKIGIEAHITAVAFGTTRKARARWRKRIAEGKLPVDLLRKYGLADSEPETAGAVAERLALHERFWKVPYHWVGLLNGDVLRNNDITRYTYHGDHGNGPLIGVAAEGNMPGLEKNRKKKHHGLDEHFIETNRAALRLAVHKGREAGAPVGRLYAHRQYSNGRIGDPGEGWWKEVGIPMATELRLKRMVHFMDGVGREICREWDEDGRVDYRGSVL